MRTFESFEGLENYLIGLLSTIDMSPLAKQIETIIESSIARNFKVGGRYGSGKFGGGSNTWIKSKRAIAQGGQTLVDNTTLKTSIHAKATYSNGTFDIELSAGVKDYAAVHNFGHSFRPKLPARPFLVIQDEDLEEIQNLYAEYLAKHI